MKSEKHEAGKQRKIQQLVASTDTPNLGTKGKKPRKRRRGKFNIENVSSNGNNKHSPRSRQTVLSEYFTSPTKSPKEAPKCKPERADEAADEKLVNVPLLMSQLLRARVVLSRIHGTAPPAKSEASTVPTSGTISVDPNSRGVVRRYCYKCKTLKIDRQQISKPKVCRNCGTLLIYVCMKCNRRHFAELRHLRKHSVACEDELEPSLDALASVVLRHCADCSFKSTHEATVHNHLKHTGHRELDGEKVVEADCLEDEDAVEVNDIQAKYIVKHDLDASRKGIRRYCKKCKKIVLASRTRDDVDCGTCNSRLIFRCSKCKFKTNFYRPMYYHVKVKCFPSIYRCAKCQYTAYFWQQFTIHLNTQKCSRKSVSEFGQEEGLVNCFNETCDSTE